MDSTGSMSTRRSASRACCRAPLIATHVSVGVLFVPSLPLHCLPLSSRGGSAPGLTAPREPAKCLDSADKTRHAGHHVDCIFPRQETFRQKDRVSCRQIGMPMNTHTQPPPFFEASPGASYRVDELVVALAYDRVVLEQLIQWNAAPLTDDREYDEQVTGPKVDTRLALRRVPVKADQAVAHLRGEHGDWVERATDGARDAGYASSDIDVLIRCLRYEFQRRFNGWVPGIGKNRLVSRPTGSYVIQGGGAPGPVPQPDYVIQGGGATPGPVPQPDYVIQGGGGAPRPVPQPDYVIQGGAKGRLPRPFVGSSSGARRNPAQGCTSGSSIPRWARTSGWPADTSRRRMRFCRLTSMGSCRRALTTAPSWSG